MALVSLRGCNCLPLSKVPSVPLGRSGRQLIPNHALAHVPHSLNSSDLFFERGHCRCSYQFDGLVHQRRCSLKPVQLFEIHLKGLSF